MISATTQRISGSIVAYTWKVVNNIMPLRYVIVTIPCQKYKTLQRFVALRKISSDEFKRRAFDSHRGINTAASFNAPRVCHVVLTIAYDYTTLRDGPKTRVPGKSDKRS